MKWRIAFVLLAAACAVRADEEGRYGFCVSGDGLLPPARRDAYGPGMDADATGRPFYWAPRGAAADAQSRPDPTLHVRPDAYGPGTGVDRYGRPVERRTDY